MLRPKRGFKVFLKQRHFHHTNGAAIRRDYWHSVKVLSQRGDGLILLILPSVCSLKIYNWQLLVLAAVHAAPLLYIIRLQQY